MIKLNKGRWYLKQGDRIRGPFPNKLIGSYLILGRIDLDVQVSQDKKNWSAVKNYPALVPEVVKESGTPQGDRALMLARIREDERGAQSKNDADNLEERRENEEDVIQLHRQIRDDVIQEYSKQPKRRRIYITVAISLVLIFVYFINQDSSSIKLADCHAPVEPGINWSGCNKQGEVLRNRNLKNVNFHNANLQSIDFSAALLQGADLAYANLSQAILISSQLQKSNLKGANLRQANLQEANLSGADLSYAEMVGSQLQGANLNQAIFDHAIWVNGETCLPGSIGACLLPINK